jgi:hypothetical protein
MSLVPGDFAVAAGFDLCRRDTIVDRQGFGSFPVVIPGLEGASVSFENRRILGELIADPAKRRLQRTLIKPVNQSQRKKVLATIRLARAQLDLGNCFAIQRVNRNPKHPKVLERAVFQGIDLIAGFMQVAVVEGVGIDDEDAARLEIFEIGLESRRVHRHQGVQIIPGRVNILAAKMDLKPGNAGQRTRRSTNLCGEVGQGADVVAEDGGGVGELGSRQLHTIAGIACEANGRRFELSGLRWSRAGFLLERGLRDSHGNLKELSIFASGFVLADGSYVESSEPKSKIENQEKFSYAPSGRCWTTSRSGGKL